MFETKQTAGSLKSTRDKVLRQKMGFSMWTWTGACPFAVGAEGIIVESGLSLAEGRTRISPLPSSDTLYQLNRVGFSVGWGRGSRPVALNLFPLCSVCSPGGKSLGLGACSPLLLSGCGALDMSCNLSQPSLSLLFDRMRMIIQDPRVSQGGRCKSSAY